MGDFAQEFGGPPRGGGTVYRVSPTAGGELDAGTGITTASRQGSDGGSTSPAEGFLDLQRMYGRPGDDDGGSGVGIRSTRHRQRKAGSDDGAAPIQLASSGSAAGAGMGLSLNIAAVHAQKRGDEQAYEAARLALSALTPQQLTDLAEKKPTEGFEYEVGMALCKLIGAPRKWKAVRSLLTNHYNFARLVRLEPTKVKDKVRVDVMRHMTEHDLLKKAHSNGNETTIVLIRWMSEVVKRAEAAPLSVYRDDPGNGTGKGGETTKKKKVSTAAATADAARRMAAPMSTGTSLRGPGGGGGEDDDEFAIDDHTGGGKGGGGRAKRAKAKGSRRKQRTHGADDAGGRVAGDGGRHGDSRGDSRGHSRGRSRNTTSRGSHDGSGATSGGRQPNAITTKPSRHRNTTRRDPSTPDNGVGGMSGGGGSGGFTGASSRMVTAPSMRELPPLATPSSGLPGTGASLPSLKLRGRGAVGGAGVLGKATSLNGSPLGGGGASPGSGLGGRTTVSAVSSAARSAVSPDPTASPDGPERMTSSAQARRDARVRRLSAAHPLQPNGHDDDDGGGRRRDRSRSPAATAQMQARVVAALEQGSRELAERSMRVAALGAARLAVSRLERRELAAAWAQSSKDPNAQVLLGISGALCVLFNRNPTWDSARDLVLSEGFLSTLVGLSPSDISSRCMRIMTAVSLDQKLATHGSSAPTQVVKSLASWVAAITGTHSKRGDQAVSTSLSARLLAGARDEEAGDAAPDRPPSRYDALFAIAQTSETFPQLRRLAKKAHSLAASAQQ